MHSLIVPPPMDPAMDWTGQAPPLVLVQVTPGEAALLKDTSMACELSRKTKQAHWTQLTATAVDREDKFKMNIPVIWCD